MCGISALVDRRGHPVDRALVERMNERVLHRGPDDGGIFEGPSFALGHRRLSILDLSAAGHQPMQLTGRAVVSYNGEIYNYLELRSELSRLGYQFHTTTDTEVLLAAYDQWGEQCVRRFNGMWAFVLWDRARATLFCSRDRFGIKPLHYVELGQLFAIGSEIKQFLDLPGFTPSADPVSAYRFLNDGAVGFDEREFFEGVRSLRGGHNLRFDLSTGRFSIERWYDPATATASHGRSFEEACEEFRLLFSDAVRLRLRSDVSVGVCLSGGIDSSSIAAVAQRVADPGADIRSVSCLWDDPSCDESWFIDEVVRSCSLHAISARPNMDDLLAKGTLDLITYHQDQPVLGASQFAEYSVFQAARQHGLVVMLDGQGADEYLAGYAWSFPPFVRTLLLSGQWGLASREVRKRASLRGIALHAALRSLWGSLVSGPLSSALRSTQVRPRLGDWAGPLLHELHGQEVVVHDRFHGASTVREQSLRELVDTSMPQQLHSEDRNSMLHSVESRLPFMDYRLVELCLSMPDAYKLRDGATKAVVREALRGILPEAIRNRHDKVGFPAPEESWVRRNTALVRAELLAAAEQFPALVAPEAAKGFDRFVRGDLAYDPVYFRILALSRWGRVTERSRDARTAGEARRTWSGLG